MVKGKGFLGFIAYKVGMVTTMVKDNTENSMTKGKKIIAPATILEVPNMKIFSVRFYKFGKVMKEIVVSSDKELKRVVRLPKQLPAFDAQVPQGYEDIRVILYSLPKQTSIKKAPDLIEVGIGAEDKLAFVKSFIGKEISLKEALVADLLDIRGLTTGKGLVGPVKRFGITLKQHKTEKGVRRPGSLAPWHPARVTYTTPQAGQLGMFSRVHYNLKVITSGTIQEKNINPDSGFIHYGKINSAYVLVKGSVQGVPKRQILCTPAFRPTKHSGKQKLEFVEIVK